MNQINEKQLRKNDKIRLEQANNKRINNLYKLCKNKANGTILAKSLGGKNFKFRP